MEKEKYYELIKQWMQYFRFDSLTPHPESGTELVFHKSETKLSKFGKVDTYIFIKHFSTLDANTVVQYSTRMYGHASKHRTGGPLGFGAMLIVLPLIVTDKISNEAYNTVMQYCPKHFAAAEFPSILDLSTEYLYYYDKTPVWGMAYYDGYRRDTYKYFSPASWRELAKYYEKGIKSFER